MNTKSPAAMLPISVEIPYVPKPPTPRMVKEKMFRERNLGTFKRPDPLDVPADEEL